MKLSTIWTLKSLPLKERIFRTVDWSAMTIAGKLPLRIRYWATMLEIAKVTTGPLSDQEVPGIPLSDIISNLEAPKRMS